MMHAHVREVTFYKPNNAVDVCFFSATVTIGNKSWLVGVFSSTQGAGDAYNRHRNRRSRQLKELKDCRVQRWNVLFVCIPTDVKYKGCYRGVFFLCLFFFPTSQTSSQNGISNWNSSRSPSNDWIAGGWTIIGPSRRCNTKARWGYLSKPFHRWEVVISTFQYLLTSDTGTASIAQAGIWIVSLLNLYSTDKLINSSAGSTGLAGNSISAALILHPPPGKLFWVTSQ